MLTVLVAVTAGVGAVCRYGLDQVVQARTDGELPWGTFVVNALGSLLLGLVLGLQAHRGLPADVALVLGAGFAGGFTTLSTWTWETLALAQRGSWGAACANVAGSLAVGLLAAAAGLGLALV